MVTAREHWTEVDDPSSDPDLLDVANRQHFHRLLATDAALQLELREGLTNFRRSDSKKYKASFFKDFGNQLVVGEKIGEGGQAEIFKAAIGGEDEYALKEFKPGFSLAELENQWTIRSKNGYYMKSKGSCCYTESGTLLSNGRFAFVMQRYWGDLRKLIDQRMKENNGQGPPFSFSGAWGIMMDIAYGMAQLHDHGTLHRDLKAANVLVSVCAEGNISSEFVADFDSSAGVVGTGFWRAPEVLDALKNKRVLDPIIWTGKVDVYSYAMTFYEVLTGRFPFGDLDATSQNYDAVIRGERPLLPNSISNNVQKLLRRCWHEQPSQRPTFRRIQEWFFFLKDW